MAGTKSTALQNSQADSLVANLDGLELIDSSGPTTLVTYTGFSWDPASSGTTSVSSTLSSSASSSGTADEARLYDDSGASGEEISTLTVTSTGAGGDVELDNTSINSGQTVEITSADITEPSSTQ